MYLSLFLIPALLEAGDQDESTLAELSARAESDPFFLAVSQDLRAAYDQRASLRGADRRTWIQANPSLQVKADVFVSVATSGVGTADSYPQYQKAKATKSAGGAAEIQIPSYHLALWAITMAEAGTGIRATIDRLLGPDRATFEATCEGLPADVVDFTTYMVKGGKYQSNYVVSTAAKRYASLEHLKDPFLFDVVEKDKDGKDVTVTRSLSTGFRNDLHAPARKEAADKVTEKPASPVGPVLPAAPVEGA